jgi:hypothetical protein
LEAEAPERLASILVVVIKSIRYGTIVPANLAVPGIVARDRGRGVIEVGLPQGRRGEEEKEEEDWPRTVRSSLAGWDGR